MTIPIFERFQSPGKAGISLDRALLGAVEGAAQNLGRLAQIANQHPLAPALLYRSRMIAIQDQSSVDGMRINPWHLAAILEGLRLRMDPSLSPFERGSILEAARYALGLHQWMVSPDEEQEAEIKQAEIFLQDRTHHTAPIATIADAAHGWLDHGGSRAALRGAMVRYWMRHKILKLPIPITGAKSLIDDVSFDLSEWRITFLQAIAREARDNLDLLYDIERSWVQARSMLGQRRRNSRAAAAIDVLAATPIISATNLAKRIGMATSNATALLRELQEADIVIDVSRRSKRQLFCLGGMGRLRDYVSPPPKPEFGRKRGRPPANHASVHQEYQEHQIDDDLPISSREPFDYMDLDEAMAHADQVIRDTKLRLDEIARRRAES